MNHQQAKPDISFATKTGHFHLLPTFNRLYRLYRLSAVPLQAADDKARVSQDEACVVAENTNRRWVKARRFRHARLQLRDCALYFDFYLDKINGINLDV